MSLILEEITENTLEFEDITSFRILAGIENENLKYVGKILKLEVHSRGCEIKINGNQSNVKKASELLKQFYKIIKKGYHPKQKDFESGLNILEGNQHNLEEIFLDTVCLTTDRKTIAPKSINQKLYIDSIRKNDLVFGIGPAGTGKTYLAVAMAVSYLNLKKVKRIILTRPAVEAGEKLGFLPGDLNEKVDPYLRPLFDALNEMIDPERIARLIDRSIIEIAPLAFMRGRTLNDSFIILDEAQNTTTSQMKMFLTRLGFNSKTIITGDITQIDLEKNIKSGLIEAQSLLNNINGIAFSSFSNNDVIRHPLVKKIIDAYK
ncbi:MAG: PhoH family protein [Deltaproteobacteria bacterium TMED126]|jgi:phosphate starvation-inducible PhoH-like protein|nr:PhoH family protein [Candidatus Dadabacteria bacterium]NSW97220.1 PhoH family protein [Deltaproteobacteria bacterium TMED126]|tara:strand:- start:45762 stop:46718 length:957 start_codon:yes stop_codon:yes gene_type:complete